MVVCIQKPDEESEWLFYLAPDYGDWLLKEVELRYRISFPELFPETSDSEQEGNDAVETTAPQKTEVMAMRVGEQAGEIRVTFAAEGCFKAPVRLFITWLELLQCRREAIAAVQESVTRYQLCSIAKSITSSN